MKYLETIQRILKEKIIAVIRTGTRKDALRADEAAFDGGIRLIENTMTTPGALQVILELKEKYGHKMEVGAGTVIDEVSARLAIYHGADIIICSHLDAKIIKRCDLYQIPVIPGTLTKLALKTGDLSEVTEYGKFLIERVREFDLGAVL